MIKGLNAATILCLACASMAAAADVNSYQQTNLSSDLKGVAANQDPNLVNPWGLVASPTGPFWTANNGSGTSTLYNGDGVSFPPKSPLVVTIPPAGSGSPTGIVFNGTSNFGGSPFVYDSEDGSVTAWKGGTSAVVEATGASGSVYKGLAINSAGTMLYAANFGLDRVDVYNGSFGLVKTTGNFVDPGALKGYAPFNVQDIGGELYVAYARSNGGHDEIDGAGLGYVDVFDENGTFVKRLASNGPLNAPWGLTMAPSGFGAFSNDLLVGNFGDGTIDAFNPKTGAFLGALDGANGKPLSIEGLWGLSFGNGSFDQGTDTLFFNAGIPGPGNVEDHGLFGAINAVPEPGSAGLLLLGFSAAAAGLVRRLRS